MTTILTAGTERVRDVADPSDPLDAVNLQSMQAAVAAVTGRLVFASVLATTGDSTTSSPAFVTMKTKDGPGGFNMALAIPAQTKPVTVFALLSGSTSQNTPPKNQRFRFTLNGTPITETIRSHRAEVNQPMLVMSAAMQVLPPGTYTVGVEWCVDGGVAQVLTATDPQNQQFSFVLMAWV